MIRNTCLAVTALALLVLGCIPSGTPPIIPEPEYKTCTETELTDLRYSGSVVGGDVDRIVFERSAYTNHLCVPPRNYSSITSQPPVERTWVLLDLPTMSQSMVMPTIMRWPGNMGGRGNMGWADNIVTDAHWVVINNRYGDAPTLRDLDLGTEQTILTGISDLYLGVIGVARPYVLQKNNTSAIALNIETGVSRIIPNAIAPMALSRHYVVYAEFVDPAFYIPTARQLKLLNLETDEVTIIDEHFPNAYYSEIKVLETRIVLLEYLADSGTAKIQVYDLQTGVKTTLATIERYSEDYPEGGLIDDIGENGVIVQRIHLSPTYLGLVSIELLGYDGSTRMVDSWESQPGLRTGPLARFAGPYVAYPKDLAWNIYNPADGTTRTVDPFAQLPPATAPAE